MRKVLFTIAVSLVYSCLLANHVDESTAKAVGLHFFAAKVSSKKLGVVTGLQLVYTGTDANAVPCYYVYNVTGKKGFIIVAADDVSKPILGYSDESEFNATRMPVQLKSWLSGYTSQISLSINQNTPQTESVKSSWQELLTPLPQNKIQTFGITTFGTPVVSPMLTTTWDQNPDVYYKGKYYGAYNQNCPFDSAYSQNALTGCVATAMAQVMKFWNYPAKGTGTHSYVPLSFPKYGTLFANFGATTYNWTSMPDALNQSSSPAQNDAVATLIYHCGVSVNMNYGVNGSSSYLVGGYPYNAADYALVAYFGYSAQGIYRANYGDNQWVKLIENELDSSRPVLYGGQDTALHEGHAFVADGYDNNNLIHFNWGWGGINNGYFLVSDLSPGGGANGRFNSQQTAIIGIQPSSTPPPSIKVFAFSPTTGTTGTPITIHGKGFSNTVSTYGGVYFGNYTTKIKSQADSIVVLSDSVLIAWVGNGASGNVYVTTILGADSISGFTYIPLPTVSSAKWTYLGNKGFSATRVFSDVNTVCGTDNVPYIAYLDSTYKAIVMKYTNNAWSAVGAAVSTGKCSNLALLLDNTNNPIVAFADSTNSGACTIKRFNGTSWTVLGTTKLIKYNFSVALDNTNKPYVYEGHSVYTLGSGLWSTYGKTKFSTPNGYWNIAIDKKTNTPYVAFDEIDASGYPQVSVMKYSANSWVYVGNAKFTTAAFGIYYLDIALDSVGTPMVSFQEDNGFERGSVYQYTNGKWSTLGSPRFTHSHTYYPTISIDRKNNPLILYSDFTYNGEGTVMYNNSAKDWTLMGERGFAPSLSFGRNAIAPDANNNMLVAFVDNSQANKVSVMKYTGFPLPLQLLSFDALITAQNKVQLSWKTSNEQNISNFIVQTSINGNSFSAIGSISAAGSGNNSYQFLDNNSIAGSNYYRLVYVDKSGKVSYSKVVEVVVKKQGLLTLYPNPAKNVLTLSITNSANEPSIVKVVDVLGNVVKQQTVQLVAGSNRISLAIDNLAKGSYFVVIKGSSTQQKQFIKY